MLCYVMLCWGYVSVTFQFNREIPAADSLEIFFFFTNLGLGFFIIIKQKCGDLNIKIFLLETLHLSHDLITGTRIEQT